MNEQEARLIGFILATADGRCDHCVGNLVEQIEKIFPDYDWKKYIEEYNYKIYKLMAIENMDAFDEEYDMFDPSDSIIVLKAWKKFMEPDDE